MGFTKAPRNNPNPDDDKPTRLCIARTIDILKKSSGWDDIVYDPIV